MLLQRTKEDRYVLMGEERSGVAKVEQVNEGSISSAPYWLSDPEQSYFASLNFDVFICPW